MSATHEAGPIPGPNAELMIDAAFGDAMFAALGRRKHGKQEQDAFLNDLLGVADEYDRLGNVCRLHGVSPMLTGLSRKQASAWLRAYVSIKRRREAEGT